MNSIPDIGHSFHDLTFPQLFYWVSQLVYGYLIRHDSNHILVRLHYCLDLSRIEQSCAGFHHATGPGASPSHSVPRLVRALLVSYLFNWSTRTAEFQIRFNILVKWYVGYAIFELGPDHATLNRFHDWVCQQQHRTLFDDVLKQIDNKFPEERGAAQAGDTFAMQANAAKEKPIDLIRHGARRLLSVLKKANAGSHRRVTTSLDSVALFGPPDERNEFHLDEAGRKQRMQTTVVAACQCLALVRAELDSSLDFFEQGRAEVSTWLQYLSKIIDDEVEIERDERGQITKVKLLAKKKHGAYRLGSATDPQATYRVHGEDKIDLGFNVSLATSVTKDSKGKRRARFIREIQVHTGAKPDGATVAELLEAQQKHQGLTPEKLIFDAAAGTGKTLAAVEEVSQGRTQLVAPLVDYERRNKRFGPSDFRLSEGGTTLTCPGGKESTKKYRSGSGDGYNFRFLGEQCVECTLRQQCRPFVEEEESEGPGESEGGVEVQGERAVEAGSAGVEEASPSRGRTSSAEAENCDPKEQDGQKGASRAKGKKAKDGKSRKKSGGRTKKDPVRNIFISDYRPQVEAARAYQQTDEYKDDMKQRPLVERVISVVTRYGGARRARRRGIDKGDFQAKMCALAYNLKELVRLLDKVPLRTSAQP